jgi:modification methylase
VIYLIAKPKFKLAPKANAYGNVWEFMQEMNNEHPAAFPVALIDRIISSTNARVILANSIVLPPSAEANMR